MPALITTLRKLPRRPQPEPSSRPKSYPQHHLSHTSSAALPPPPPAASPRGPLLPSSAPSEPPPAHAHQPKVLHLNSEQVKSPIGHQVLQLLIINRLILILELTF